MLCAAALVVASGCAHTFADGTPESAVRAAVLRLRPGQDIKVSLEAWVRDNGVRAAVVLSVVGSVEHLTLRFADQPNSTVLEGRREVVALGGTLSAQGGSHLHVAVADGSGTTLGGHLLDGSRVYTTLEIALGVLPDVGFSREVDPTWGWHELVVWPAPIL